MNENLRVFPISEDTSTLLVVGVYTVVQDGTPQQSNGAQTHARPKWYVLVYG